MKQKAGLEQLNTDQLEGHLRSAVDELTPNVLSKIDLNVPQDAVPHETQTVQAAILRMQRRIRGFALASAACLCVIAMGGGAYGYHVQNRRVESVIGIDVNPSIELSINRKGRVLSVCALNQDAQEIIADMDLEGVDLNVAVNALVGSMVTHGYLDDLDNAILVTVTNDSVRKAKELRASVVNDIEATLEENQVQAVVYDQQVIEDEETEALAKEYGISYGKAYFLKELISQNMELTMDDMGELSSMTMEEIAARIAKSSYALGELADQATETTSARVMEPETTEAETEPSSEGIETEPATTEAETTAAPETTAEPTTEAEDEILDDQVEIDYVDYEDGTLYVYFVTRVKWKNPTVAVRDSSGNSYAAMVDETSSDECIIEAAGLEGGQSYTFVLGGLTPKEGSKATTVKGYFEVPEIAEEATDSYEDEEESESDSMNETNSIEESKESDPAAVEIPSGTEDGGQAGTEADHGTQGGDHADDPGDDSGKSLTEAATEPVTMGGQQEAFDGS